MTLINKIADPKDFDKPEYAEIKKWYEDKLDEAYYTKHLPATYSEVFRAWEYAQMHLYIPFHADSKIVDLGCCRSLRPLWYMAHGVKEYTTFDMEHEAKRHELYDYYYPDGRIKIDVGDMHKLPYADHSFDIALSVSVVEHLADPKKALREMARIVKPGGYIGLTTDFSDRKVLSFKSGREFDKDTVQDVFIDTLINSGCESVGETNFENVDITDEKNRVVREEYTFASLVFRKQ